MTTNDDPIVQALEFYANPANWHSPSSGFAAQYDPTPSLIDVDRGLLAQKALACLNQQWARIHKLEHDNNAACIEITRLTNLLNGETTMSRTTLLADILESLEKDAARIEQASFDPFWEDQDDMQRMLRADAADIRKVAKFCKEGDWKNASNTMYHMDTAARDEINDTAYQYIKERYS